jgi:sigma-B regulation protein RsbU (phosphoserine phosphatase)
MGSSLQFSLEEGLAGVGASELLNSLADGVYITDAQRKIVFWNRAAERITGWRSEDVVGKSCSDNILVHTDKDGHPLCGEESCPLHRSIVTGQPSTEPLLVFAQCKSQLRIPVEVSVSPIRDRDGRVTAGIEVFRDQKESMYDLLRAKTIQDLVLSSPLPEDRRVEFEVRYQAREIIGGDFYRIERQDADRYAVLVADAMGHGVPAALYTMQLRSLWDDHREELQSPARFLALLSRRLHALVHDAGYFATAVCLTYDAVTGEVRCVRAGHPAPLLFRNHGACEPVGRAQFALGMMPEASYQETTVQLAPGDALLLFTDGATELFDPTDKEMGIPGLERLVRALEQGLPPNSFHLDKLEEMLLRFTDQIHLPDDLTLLKLWRKR